MEKDIIKLVSVNIELAKHLDLVRAFLEKEKPDVACLQEAYKIDLKEFAKEFAMEAVFGQMGLIGRVEYTKPPFFPYGVGILSALPIQDVQRRYYSGNEEIAKTRVFQGSSSEDAHPLLLANIQKGNANFTIGITHFTWSPGGSTDDLQRSDLKSLLGILEDTSEIVLCGDFNAPRGGEIFDTLARRYTDNIPLEYHTSIDVNLHRDGRKLAGESLMVDGLFTTPFYQCSNVRLVGGVSDHFAVVAEVGRI